jgi:hypothetical protein
MPLNNKTRLQSVQTPDPSQFQPQQQQTTGKRTGQFMSGMVNFYGNILKGAASKLKGGGGGPKKEEAPPYG